MTASTSNRSVIVFVDHHDNLQDDRAWTGLGSLGFEQRLVCPFRGEPLPPLGPELAGAVIYGGLQNVHEQDQFPYLKDEIRWIERCLESHLPVLGLCLGGQLIAHTLGARVHRRIPTECEFGYYPLTPTAEAPDWLPKDFFATEAHCEEFDIPTGAVHLASSERFPHQAFRFGDHVLALQFHPEISPSIFRRWQNAEWSLYDIPGAQERHEQDRLMALYDDAQGRWFDDLLAKLFRKAAA